VWVGWLVGFGNVGRGREGGSYIKGGEGGRGVIEGWRRSVGNGNREGRGI